MPGSQRSPIAQREARLRAFALLGLEPVDEERSRPMMTSQRLGAIFPRDAGVEGTSPGNLFG